MQHQQPLALHTLCRNKAHLGIARRPGNRACVRRVVLLAAHELFHIGRRDQSHFMAELGKLAPQWWALAQASSPTTRCLLLEKLHDLVALQFLLHHCAPFRVHAVHEETGLCDVEADGGNRSHGGWLL
jgi:hypothetical protein